MLNHVARSCMNSPGAGYRRTSDKNTFKAAPYSYAPLSEIVLPL
jgi:hypothetical protein